MGPLFRNIIAVMLLLFSAQTFGQVMPVYKNEKRQNIDGKRMVADMNSEDALPRSREFIRIDSTYYVGWMFEGTYKYNHAADLLGYKNATIPLEKAFRQITRDYSAQIKNRSNDVFSFYYAYPFQVDYTMIAGMLFDCYNNINQPEKAFELCLRVKKWKIRRDLMFPVYSNMAWVVHRNRYFTSSKYSFLKNTVAENELLAQNYLDSGFLRIKKDHWLNENFFAPGYEKNELNAVYHYKAILYNYAMEVDSTERYYNLMKENHYFSYNNYAIFQSCIANFREAYSNFESASVVESGDKRLQEWAYFNSILDIYKGNGGKAIEGMKDMIKAVGSTPGFGWYNIALARAESYMGRLDQSERHADKAIGFKEVNIGTTLGDGQYAFSANMVNLMNDGKRVKEQKFEHKNWWYNILMWPKMMQLTIKRYLQQYLLVNQLAMNPERDDVIYPLFASENTVSFDEIWYLIQDFSTSYFLKKYTDFYHNEKRKAIRKYDLLFMAKLKMEQGKYKSALEDLEAIDKFRDLTDEEYEKLFLARVYEAKSICYKKTKDYEKERQYLYAFYKEFPQLLPYSGLKMKFKLNIENTDKKLLSKLKKYRISWTDEELTNVPELIMNFSNQGEKQSVSFTVKGNNNETLIPFQTYTYDNLQLAADYVAYALFKIDKTDKKLFQDEEK